MSASLCFEEVGELEGEGCVACYLELKAEASFIHLLVSEPRRDMLIVFLLLEPVCGQ